ncbi:MAG: carboxypeptidase-like regulatory domain-containing protein, partial [Bacteroidota bacterium]
MKKIFRFLQILLLVLLWGGAFAQAPYCTPTYTTGCTYGDGITLFQLGTINQTIACNGSPNAWYHDYTALSTTMTTGTPYTLTVQAGYSSTYMSLWIDLNNNNTFDAGEIMVTNLICSASATNYTATITIPAGTTAGAHRLRYRTEWLGGPTNACSSQAYGNSADFTINVAAATFGTLTGTVTNSVTLAPIAGASVVVNALAPVLTNAAGVYTVPNLTPGTVTVNITAAGYVPYSGTAVMVGGTTTTKNVALAPSPKINGTVTDASTGAPVVGATVTIDLPSPTNLPVTMTIAGGIIPLTQVNVTGVHNFYINKTGYDQFVGSVTLTGGNTSALTAALLPTAVPPGPFTAALNNPTTPTAVNLNWGIPQGSYQIIYDDGGEENFAIWATANNLNALKFTPLSWPVKLIGGKVNLGLATDYPANALPFTTFTMLAYKADGPGGVPGTKIDSVTVTATAFGWADFAFAVPLTINSGDFYLVMKQGGIPPHAAGVAVDLTNTQLRSYSKFVTGGGPWVPAAGNFMMRAIVQGIGGPMDFPVANKNLITAGAPDGLIYQSPVATVTGYEGTADYPAITPTYQVWRLQQGQEGTPASWVSIWTGATNTTVDNGWPSLACGPYRWAV